MENLVVTLIPNSIPMQCLPPIGHCLNCLDLISPIDLQSSVSNTGHALCSACEVSLKQELRSATRATIKFYFSLRQSQLSVELRSDDSGQVSIHLLTAGLKIEVDAPRINANPLRSLNELQWTLESWQRLSQAVLHVPNDLVAYNLKQTTEYFVSHIRALQTNIHSFGVRA